MGELEEGGIMVNSDGGEEFAIDLYLLDSWNIGVQLCVKK